MTPAPENRESREFFYITERGGVTKVVGYICEAEGYWWVPEMGVSACEGYSLFRDRYAYEVAVARCRRTADAALAMLAELERERWA